MEQFKPAAHDSHYLLPSASLSGPLSHIVERTEQREPGRLTVNLANIQNIDQVPARFQTVTSLHLSNTKLTSLRGIQQFRELSQLTVSHNLLKDVSELSHILHPEKIVVLSLQGNPLSSDPDLLPLCLQQFPHLKELDGVKINDHVRQDIADAQTLAQKFIEYFYQNELALVELDKGLKKARLKIELTLAMQKAITPATGPFWEDLNYRSSRLMSKLPNFPKMPNYEHSKSVRPYMLLNYLSVAEKFLRTTFPCAEEHLPNEVTKVKKWVFCEVVLHLHSWGSQDLLAFIQQRIGSAAAQEVQLEAEFQEFLRLGKRMFPAVSQRFADGKTDVYPNKHIQPPAKVAVDPSSEVYFPVFACEPKYLRGLLCIAENQVRAMETVVLETIDALRVDFSQYGVPSLSDPRASPEPPLTAADPVLTIKPQVYTEGSQHSVTAKRMEVVCERPSEEELQDSVFRSSLELAEASRQSAVTLSHTEKSCSEAFQSEFVSERPDAAVLDSGEYTFRSTQSVPVYQEVLQLHTARRNARRRRELFAVWKRHFLNSEVHYALFKAKQHHDSRVCAVARKAMAAWRQAVERKANDDFVLSGVFYRKSTLKKVFRYWSFESAKIARVEMSRAIRYAESRLALKMIYSWRLFQARRHNKRKVARARQLAVRKPFLKRTLTRWLDLVRPSRKYCHTATTPRKKTIPRKSLNREIENTLNDIKDKEKTLTSIWAEARRSKPRTRSCRTCSKEQARSLSKEISRLKDEMSHLRKRGTVQ